MKSNLDSGKKVNSYTSGFDINYEDSAKKISNGFGSNRVLFRLYDLAIARTEGSSEPEEDAQFQKNALNHFSDWYERYKSQSGDVGEILFLPTGAGKTHVAIRFLCTKPLSDGYKVLWLAHTHHLLEQAFYSFEKHLGQITEPRKTLGVRVVSGTKGHFKIHAISPKDDVIIATLQTITKAYNESHPALLKFLDSAKEKIFVVFDEAHHAAAPSYRRLILNLRERYPKMYLLGLTATPYSKKEGWLAKIFPQNFKQFISASELMAQGILAKPNPVQVKTDIVPDFDEREYKKWISSFQDRLPENIITELAENETRNLKIAKHYKENAEKYGKTIIFADRWYQCEVISEFLKEQKIKTGTLYTHIDADPDGNADARNKRRANENDLVLEAFRKNEIQVVLNVRILTEGTNIPDVKTVFITMQTTSQNLLTQMVGRALRGPKFGGKAQAYLVFFIDNWKKLINWADYKPLVDTIVGTDEPTTPRIPLEPISIELVRIFARMMYQPISELDPYISLLPAGWYQIEYTARKADTGPEKQDLMVGDNGAESYLSDGRFADSEEIETLRRLVLVFDHEKDNYNDFIKFLLKSPPPTFEDDAIQFKDVEANVDIWQKAFFANAKQHFGSDLAQDIFGIARHISQNNEQPRFFEFKERNLHDLEKIAKDVLDGNYSYDQADEFLLTEYNNDKRYWKVFYPSYDQFYKQFHIYIGKIRASMRKKKPEDPGQKIITEEIPQDDEPSEEFKREVIKRDGKCLSCGSTRNKQVDHILSKHDGGSHQIDNLQTLCKKCNLIKKEKYIDFTVPCFADSLANFQKRKIDNVPTRDQPPKEMPPNELQKMHSPSDNYAGDPFKWEIFLRGTINFFYQCGAVHNVIIGKKGDSFYHWRVELNAGNEPRWIEPYLKELLNHIAGIKQRKGYRAPTAITISAPNKHLVNFTLSRK